MSDAQVLNSNLSLLNNGRPDCEDISLTPDLCKGTMVTSKGYTVLDEQHPPSFSRNDSPTKKIKHYNLKHILIGAGVLLDPRISPLIVFLMLSNSTSVQSYYRWGSSPEKLPGR